MHRWCRPAWFAWVLALLALRPQRCVLPAPPPCLPNLAPAHPPPACSIRDDVVPLALVQRLADELQQSSRSFQFELLPVSAWRGPQGRCRGILPIAMGPAPAALQLAQRAAAARAKARWNGCYASERLLASLLTSPVPGRPAQDGDHRLSREGDLHLVCRLLGQLVQQTLDGTSGAQP